MITSDVHYAYLQASFVKLWIMPLNSTSFARLINAQNSVLVSLVLWRSHYSAWIPESSSKSQQHQVQSTANQEKSQHLWYRMTQLTLKNKYISIQGWGYGENSHSSKLGKSMCHILAVLQKFVTNHWLTQGCGSVPSYDQERILLSKIILTYVARFFHEE